MLGVYSVCDPVGVFRRRARHTPGLPFGYKAWHRLLDAKILIASERRGNVWIQLSEEKCGMLL
jgi:hypothetical protein